MTREELRRQCERIMFDILYDQSILTWTGSFCQMDVGAFGREHRWRNYQVKEALKDLDRTGYIRGLKFEHRSASFHLVPPPPYAVEKF